MQEKFSIVAIAAVITAVFTTTLVMSLTVQSADAASVCTKSFVCAGTYNPSTFAETQNGKNAAGFSVISPNRGLGQVFLNHGDTVAASGFCLPSLGVHKNGQETC